MSRGDRPSTLQAPLTSRPASSPRPRWKNFDDDLAGELDFLSQEDPGHPPAAEFAIDTVDACAKRGLET